MSAPEVATSSPPRCRTKFALTLVALCLPLLAAAILRPTFYLSPGAKRLDYGSAMPEPSYPPSILGMSRRQVEATVGTPRRVEARKTPQGRLVVCYYLRRRGPGYLRVEYQNGVAYGALRLLSLP